VDVHACLLQYDGSAYAAVRLVFSARGDCLLAPLLLSFLHQDVIRDADTVQRKMATARSVLDLHQTNLGSLRSVASHKSQENAQSQSDRYAVHLDTMSVATAQRNGSYPPKPAIRLSVVAASQERSDEAGLQVISGPRPPLRPMHVRATRTPCQPRAKRFCIRGVRTSISHEISRPLVRPIRGRERILRPCESVRNPRMHRRWLTPRGRSRLADHAQPCRQRDAHSDYREQDPPGPSGHAAPYARSRGRSPLQGVGGDA